MDVRLGRNEMLTLLLRRQATQEQTEDPPRYGQGQGCHQEEGQVSGSLGVWGWGLLVDNACVCTHCDGFHHIAHGNSGRHESMDGMNLDRSPRLSSISIKGVLLPQCSLCDGNLCGSLAYRFCDMRSVSNFLRRNGRTTSIPTRYDSP